MESFADRLAVITGAGSGMGRELAVQLAAEGCHLALCDLSEANLAETKVRCADGNPAVTVSTHLCDVADEDSVLAFRDATLEAHGTDHVHLVFSNAGIGGGGSFIADEREDWERTFNVCWGGVYNVARAFVPLLVAAEAGHLVNTSSINGFWASLGPNQAHTAYSAAKFAVKGFSEALITDLRLNAPHVKVSVVMPGHIGTDIVANSRSAMGKEATMTAEEVSVLRARLVTRGLPVDNVPDDAIREFFRQRAEDFREKAPTSAAEASTVILDGVRAGRWRILVGADAEALDERVRATPEDVYESEFLARFNADGHFNALTR
ncbi:MAG: SDR family oxidoreductase [Alphaproteobacteria bacterium]